MKLHNYIQKNFDSLEEFAEAFSLSKATVCKWLWNRFEGLVVENDIIEGSSTDEVKPRIYYRGKI